MKVIPVAIPPAATFSASLAAIGQRGRQTATTMNRLLAVGQTLRPDRPILLHLENNRSRARGCGLRDGHDMHRPRAIAVTIHPLGRRLKAGRTESSYRPP